MPAKAPIAVTTPPPRDAPTDIHPALRRPKTGGDNAKDEGKRDSGLAPTTSSRAREGSVNTTDAIEEEVSLGVEIDFDKSSKVVSPLQSPTQASTSKVITKSPSIGSGSMRWKPGSRKSSNGRVSGAEKTDEEKEFVPITTDIPTDEFLDEEFLRTLSFSKRGSVMLGGRKVVNGHARANVGRRYVGGIVGVQGCSLTNFLDNPACPCLFRLLSRYYLMISRRSLRRSDQCMNKAQI